MSSEPSVEPSLMQMTSMSLRVCMRADSRHWSRYLSTLQMGTRTETSGELDALMRISFQSGDKNRSARPRAF